MTATATAGSGSDNNDGATPDMKGRGEVIGVDGNDKDYGGGARSSSMAVVVDGCGNGMEPMEPISVDEGCGKDAIAAAAINRQCSPGWPPLPLLMMNKDRWLLAVIVINCAAVAMIGGEAAVMAAATATETTIN